MTDACSSEKISLSSEQNSATSDASSSAYVLFENKSETSEPPLSTSTPILPPHELASSPRAKVKAGYESDVHATPQLFGALIELREIR